MRVWVDIENPPQVQYLLPLERAFVAAGAETVLTARDYGATVELLDRAGAQARVFGTRAGRGRARKAYGLARRAWALDRLFARTGMPDALVAASRPAAVVAARRRVPSWIIGDYEHANVSVYRLTGSTILHPRCVDGGVFVRRGLRPDRVRAFDGIKEDLTFAGVDVDAVAPHDLGPRPAGAPRVLFRPPSETSHYYDAASSRMAVAALRHLAARGAQVVLSPREPAQRRMLDGIAWPHPPIVLERPAPFVALLKAVDAVVCSGGTMLREAAYLGIPAYSIFCSEVGGVDRWLERLGRATLIADEAGLGALVPVVRRGGLDRLDANPHLVEDLVALVTAAVQPAKRPTASATAAISPAVSHGCIGSEQIRSASASATGSGAPPA